MSKREIKLYLTDIDDAIEPEQVELGSLHLGKAFPVAG